jgi:hypothetical protein
VQLRPWPPVLEMTARAARVAARKGVCPLAMRIRDELGEEATSRAWPARSTVSARPKLWITLAVGAPVSGWRSLWASCRQDTVEPSRLGGNPPAEVNVQLLRGL